MFYVEQTQRGGGDLNDCPHSAWLKTGPHNAKGQATNILCQLQMMQTIPMALVSSNFTTTIFDQFQPLCATGD